MIGNRPIWRTVKMRAEDLQKGDVTRNSFGKWDVVHDITGFDSDDLRYVTIHFEVGSSTMMRTVHLVDVQVVKPS